MVEANASADPQVAAADLIEIDLPEGLNLPELGESASKTDTSSEAPKAEVEKEPEKVEPAKPAKTGDVRQALRAERETTRKYRKLWKDTEAELAEYRGRPAGPASTPTIAAPHKAVSPKADVARVRKTADEGATMGEGAIASLTEVQRMFDENTKAINDLFEQHTKTINDRLSDHALAIQLNLCRGLFDDFDDVMTQAGIWDAISIIKDPGTGQDRFKDPALGVKIYRAAFPPLYAYQLARGKLLEEGKLIDPDEETSPLAEPKKSEPVKTVPSPELKTPEGERREAHRVVEVVAANAARPSGIRSIPNAGGPRRVGLTRDYLTRLMEENPVAYQRLIDQRPELVPFHLGGLPLSGTT